MEEKVLIQNLKIYPAATADQTKALMEELLKSNAKEIVLVPDGEKEYLYQGFLLEKYYTPALTDTATVRNFYAEGPFRCFLISRHALRSYLQYLNRKMCSSSPKKGVSEFDLDKEFFDLLQANKDAHPESTVSAPPKSDPILTFLQTHSPAKIQQELEQRVIGQRELTCAVADFLYYHALRLRHPELPQRPLLIAGPSGSGKTEVWRVASMLYGDLFQIQIVDGSNLSCDGWAGNYKLSSFITTQLADGGILIVDEFDKLAKPKYTSGGDNVSLQMQAEFLKLFEGEHQVTVNKKPTNITSKKMGFVLVGAFEDLRDKKAVKKSTIGFCAASAADTASTVEFTDEDFIAYGIMPEIVGRIAAKCTTQPLDDAAYMNIIRSSHSRVAVIEQVLSQYGIQIDQVIPQEELLALIAKSKDNRTGVRWVSAQVENRLLEAIREQGLFPIRPKAAA